METLIPYLLPLLLLPLSLYLIRKRNNLPPGSMGWPFVGENMELTSSGSGELFKDRMHKYSQVAFKTSFLGEKIAVLCGAQGNKFILNNQNNLFTRWLPLSLRRVMFQDHGRTTHKKEPFSQFQNFQHDFLMPDALKQYVPVMDSLARENLETKWRGSSDSVVEALLLSKKYTLSLACRVFLNIEDSEHLRDLSEALTQVTKGILSLPVNFPGTAMNRAMKGGTVLRRELLRIVEKRRREMLAAERKGDDLLSKMVVATNDDGEYMSNRMVVSVIIGVLVAAEYEVSSLITIVMYYLADLPNIYVRVLQGT